MTELLDSLAEHFFLYVSLSPNLCQNYWGINQAAQHLAGLLAKVYHRNVGFSKEEAGDPEGFVTL